MLPSRALIETKAEQSTNTHRRSALDLQMWRTYHLFWAIKKCPPAASLATLFSLFRCVSFFQSTLLCTNLRTFFVINRNGSPLITVVPKNIVTMQQ